jgi:hypothetical protein
MATIKIKMEQLKNDAASQIQAGYRGWKTRRQVPQLRSSLATQLAAANETIRRLSAQLEKLTAKLQAADEREAQRRAKAREASQRARARRAPAPLQVPAPDLIVEAEAELAAEEAPELLPLPASPVAEAAVAAAAERRELPFISLINQEVWKKHWHKCFNRQMVSDSEVVVGDTGSIGIGYNITAPLPELIEGKTEEGAIAAVSTAGAVSAQVHGRTPLTANYIKKSILFFYELATAPNGTLFGIKQGTKARWVAEKTGGYFHAPPASRAVGPLISERQREVNFFEHRFSFRIVAIVPEEERQMVHHLQLVRNHAVTF